MAPFGTLTFSTRPVPARTERLTALSLNVRRLALWPFRFLSFAVILPVSRTVAARSQVTLSLSVWGFGTRTLELSGLSLHAAFRGVGCGLGRGPGRGPPVLGGCAPFSPGWSSNAPMSQVGLPGAFRARPRSSKMGQRRWRGGFWAGRPAWIARVWAGPPLFRSGPSSTVLLN